MKSGSYATALDHIAEHGDTDVFPFPVENHVLRDKKAEVAAVLEELHEQFFDRLNEDSTPGELAMAPVGYTGFRWATQLDPLWNAYLMAMVVELGPQIEDARLPATMVHSHRFDGTSSLFARDGFLSFERAALETSAEFDWVVKTDIADFYPRIYHHKLENALAETARGSDIPKRIDRLLSVWSRGHSYGLPIGGPAARLLSEIVLNRTDRLLRSNGLVFHRYADDYYLFANSKQQAHTALADLSGYLQRNEGLALSKQKTRIMSRAEFQSVVSPNGDSSAEEEFDVEVDAEIRSRRRRARELLGLTLRYDPYSPTAVDDYEALRAAVERLDIVDLFLSELSKPRIDPQLTRRLLKALEVAEPAAQGEICSSLVKNLELLAPLVPQTLLAVRKSLQVVGVDYAHETRSQLAAMFEAGSHVLQLGVNQAFLLRILADAEPTMYEPLFVQLFDRSPVFIQRDIILAMARWRATYWISDRMKQYLSYHSWVQRAFLMASYYLGDEGRHWRESIAKNLSPFDKVLRDWTAERAPRSNWELPL